MLTISGEKKSETGDKERRFRERYYGRFERSIPIDDVDQDKVGASFKDGVLTVTLAKLPSERQKVKGLPSTASNGAGRRFALSSAPAFVIHQISRTAADLGLRVKGAM